MAVLGIALAGLVTTTAMAQPKIVTFDDGMEGWDFHPDFTEVLPDGGHPGAYCNFTNFEEDTNTYHLRGWFSGRNTTDPAFVGDYTAKGPVRIELDVDVEWYDLWNWGWWMAVEQWRDLIIELRDVDNPYTDPVTGYSWPWTSVYYPAGALPNRDAGWKHFVIDVPDVHSTELPDGWYGYGGPEDPNTYEPQLPPDRTWTDVLAEVDEIRILTLDYRMFYSLNFTHNINLDNISIDSIPQECNGIEATVFVDPDGMIHGGPYDGMTYEGELVGTAGDDVIVGTDANDEITGHWGNDVICGGDGDDSINGQHDHDMILGGAGDDTLIGQKGNDFIDGGEGRDVINGGPGGDTCTNGEVVNNCGDDFSGTDPNRRELRRTAPQRRGTIDSSGSSSSTTVTTPELR
jgi:hypothetical protein